MKKKLLPILMGALLVPTVWADVRIEAERSVVGENDVLEARLRFPAQDRGDLYVAAIVQGNLLFFGEDGKLHSAPVPYKRDGLFDQGQAETILRFPGVLITPGRYRLYAAITDTGADIFDTSRWHGPLARQLFIVNEPPERSRDFDGDGWPDDDGNHDGFSDADHDFDGWRDDDADHNGIPDGEESGGDDQGGADHSGHDHGGDDDGGHDDGGNTGTGDTGGNVATGASLYGANCSGCHSPDPASDRKGVLMGADPARIRGAIASNKGGMGFLADVLSDADIQAISDFIRSKRGG
ncbi:hypothetical protein MIT9_P1074 [Methylomarinovum caldicuralii]|uniref:Cytochrome c domain-containing protein n=1 Tax=Methylomarinovum caldicuralii TaxID=438856 RepID=A0AAU9CIR0_9GAMM|nr:cytochrome c [Methylomarinovum caldicuralii]BCX81496.1 hypothetical protein MIT9_P1074 [Methylomarinovum caldicuralii]